MLLQVAGVSSNSYRHASSWLFLAERNLNKNVREVRNYLKSMVDNDPVNGWMAK